MKLITADTGIALGIQVGNKLIHQVEKAILINIIVFTIEPVNDIRSVEVVLFNMSSGTRASSK